MSSRTRQKGRKRATYNELLLPTDHDADFQGFNFGFQSLDPFKNETSNYI